MIWKTLVCLALAGGVLAPQPLVAKAPRPAVRNLTCASPVGPRDSAARLLRRFPGQARIETIAGAEGEEERALVLYPRDKRRRLEVLFWDEAMRWPSRAQFYRDESQWSVGGIRLGDSIGRVGAINGRPFDLYGFGWDYGGQVTDFRGGALDNQPGGCRVSVHFAATEGEAMIGAIIGEQTIRSDMPEIGPARPEVTILAVQWPHPQHEQE